MERLLTSKDIAAHFGVSVLTVQDWRYKRTGPPWFKQGKRAYYRESELDAYEKAKQAREQERGA